jgi:NAD(P)-dependent dehydrogenase (short-subunit alcohol dehydrogenase family)
VAQIATFDERAVAPEARRSSYPRSLHGKVALVVGGAGAIGAATSRMLAQAGATVAVTHMPSERDTKSAASVVAELGSENSAFTGVGSSIAYCAAKAGIDVMTKALARTLAPEVRVLAVLPGVVDTAFVPGRGPDFNKVSSTTPLKRIAKSDDIAAAITACATMLGYSTGHIIQVDGGRAL